jgi:ribosomal protein S18 acetylase RimI-like enzyme
MPQDDGISRRAAGQDPVRLAVIVTTDLPLLEQLVRAYYAEDGHSFRDDRQLPALAALAAGEAFGRAWLIRVGARPVGYAVLAFSFSVEAGGREACIDELYLVPEVRKRGIGRRVLALLEAEARAQGVRRVFLEVARDNRAIGLYRRAGYADQDRFLMSKVLAHEAPLADRPDAAGGCRHRDGAAGGPPGSQRRRRSPLGS